MFHLSSKSFIEDSDFIEYFHHYIQVYNKF